MDVPPTPWTSAWATGFYESNGSKIAIYPLGTWYLPCYWDDPDCSIKQAEKLAMGLQRADLVGFHRCVGFAGNRVEGTAGLQCVS